MGKIKSLEDLKKKKQDLRKKVDLRERADQAESYVQIKVGMATSGIASGAKEIYDFLSENLEKRGVEAVVTQAGDMGYSYAEPTIEVKKPGEESVVFGYVTKERADEIIEKYIKRGELVDGIIPQNYRTIDDE
jgi:NADP-reducing hydrogenase subunit HndB